jgi:hypothetical protein
LNAIDALAERVELTVDDLECVLNVTLGAVDLAEGGEGAVGGRPRQGEPGSGDQLAADELSERLVLLRQLGGAALPAGERPLNLLERSAGVDFAGRDPLLHKGLRGRIQRSLALPFEE